MCHWVKADSLLTKREIRGNSTHLKFAVKCCNPDDYGRQGWGDQKLRLNVDAFPASAGWRKEVEESPESTAGLDLFKGSLL